MGERVAAIGAGPSGLVQLRALWSAKAKGAEIPETVCGAHALGPGLRPGTHGRADVHYVPEMAGHEGWADVTFGDAPNMATGMGGGSPETEPVTVTDPLTEPCHVWHEAPSVAEKLAVLLPAARPCPWALARWSATTTRTCSSWAWR